MTEMRPEWWKANEMGKPLGFICSRMVPIHPASKWLRRRDMCVWGRWYPKKMIRDGRERSTEGFVELEKELPDVSAGLKDLCVSKSEGSFTSVLCTIECGLMGLMACICSMLEELMRAWMQRSNDCAVFPAIYGHGLESKGEKMSG